MPCWPRGSLFTWEGQCSRQPVPSSHQHTVQLSLSKAHFNQSHQGSRPSPASSHCICCHVKVNPGQLRRQLTVQLSFPQSRQSVPHQGSQPAPLLRSAHLYPQAHLPAPGSSACRVHSHLRTLLILFARPAVFSPLDLFDLSQPSSKPVLSTKPSPGHSRPLHCYFILLSGQEVSRLPIHKYRKVGPFTQG